LPSGSSVDFATVPEISLRPTKFGAMSDAMAPGAGADAESARPESDAADGQPDNHADDSRRLPHSVNDDHSYLAAVASDSAAQS